MYTTTRRIGKPDRFDALRRDRMMVGSILSYFRTLARIDRLAEKADEVEKQVERALEAMHRITLETIRLEAESKAPARSLVDDGPDYEDAADWPAWTDRDVWQATEPTPLDVLAAFGIAPISGGSPEAYEPSPEDWNDYESAFLDHIDEINQGIELDPSYFTEDDARAAGLAI